MLRALSHSDEKAFTKFHGRYYKAIFAYNMILGKGNEQLAVSLTHECLLKYAQNVKQLNSEQELYNWLRRVSRNLFIDYCRKESKRPDISSLDREQAEALIDDEYRIEKQTLIQLLEKEISELPDKDADILKAYYYQGCSQSDIAEEYHTTRKAIESRIARIRQFLKKRLSGNYE